MPVVVVVVYVAVAVVSSSSPRRRVVFVRVFVASRPRPSSTSFLRRPCRPRLSNPRPGCNRTIANGSSLQPSLSLVSI